jgi:glycosyltransferase involved in cell wall biosynthesis
MVYLEASASGLPNVGTAVDGAVEAVIDGETGILVPPRHPEQLAAAMVKLAGDPALRARMGQAGVAHAQRFSEENYLKAVDELYQRLLAAKGIPAKSG